MGTGGTGLVAAIALGLAVTLLAGAAPLPSLPRLLLAALLGTAVITPALAG